VERYGINILEYDAHIEIERSSAAGNANVVNRVEPVSQEMRQC